MPSTLSTVSAIVLPSHHHFSVKAEPVPRQLLAWRERVGHIIDVLPSLAQVARPFEASIDCYQIGDRRFTDCVSDSLVLERAVARISTDNHRHFAFHIFTRGNNDWLHGQSLQRQGLQSPASILLLDLDQPIRMQRGACRVLTLFVPRAVVMGIIPNAEALHGRVLQQSSPLARLLIKQVVALSQKLSGMSLGDAARAFDVCVQLLLGAFAKQATLSGSARAAVRAAMFDSARRYVRANLSQTELSPDSLLEALQLTRPTLYRLFQHEGGLATYIRNCRLREAADELIRLPGQPVMDVAYGLGFKSASDFTRAFRRAYEMSPQDLRALARERMLCEMSGEQPQWR
ncbi:helix-turn-helix domain-containing protein [Pseudomonas guineae]|uniref:helix-turn-helix domain-containing protein n=1 Tax=Pseudomonas guineae TaxID=425504 RepID=UPI0030EDC2F3